METVPKYYWNKAWSSYILVKVQDRVKEVQRNFEARL